MGSCPVSDAFMSRPCFFRLRFSRVCLLELYTLPRIRFWPRVSLWQAAQAMEYEALFNTLHCLPTTLAHETLALHAMNAVMVKLRQRAMTTSHGLVPLASLASFLLFACAFPRSDAVLVSLWLLPDISILGNTRPELSFLDNMPACALPRFMGSLLLCFGSSP